MAQLNLSLNINSSVNPVTGIFNLNNTTNKSVNYDITEVTSQSVSVATGSPTVLVASTVSSITYVFVKNTDANNIVVLKTDGGTSYADVGPGEFAFIPVKGAVGIEAQASGSACVIEYATFKKV
tara:strand:+ start:40 stop:411 length:372 start_codon:yes stop_codon:yes gene_type:complete